MLKNAPEYRLMSSQGAFSESLINDTLGLVLSKSGFVMQNCYEQSISISLLIKI
ncbi:hypothetical protein NIES4072_72250 [Nostoc commune NIES-4072]|uniref:Uncharacterized protein n=1 Tax=Nostoc commune NIES-4072 TaxID=2005467 RepID=A0A2R5G4X3_NOSCO|nr:hypothetical protein NIES4070_63980 [Nostoc commune HK-02]GBG23513.1 hypothetical protein NIES4072_72250 [Nostoc commune NIES-4072]